MISGLLFIGSSLLLAFEGRLFLAICAGRHLTKCEQWALGYPLGALINVLIVFLCTITGAALSFPVLYAIHVLLVASVLIKSGRRLESASCRRWKQQHSVLLIAVLSCSILVKLVYGSTHALVLPATYYDTLSQWNMRSKISFEDRSLAFDRNEQRGLSKPQYPPLLHALHIMANLPHVEWSHRIASASTLLLSLSTLFGMALILARLYGVIAGLLPLALLLMVPLLSYHLAQGYGDIHLVQYMLLSAVLLIASRMNNQTLIALSALFAASAAWVKMEGLIFAVIPWICIIAVFVRTKRQMLPALPLLLAIPWPMMLLLRGLPLSPHPSDAVFAWHPEGIMPMIHALFLSGSFGVFWYAVPVALLVVLLSKHVVKEVIPVLLWGGIVFVEALVIFLCTPNVQFLLNAQTFHRTMLLPLSLLIIALSLLCLPLCGDSSSSSSS